MISCLSKAVKVKSGRGLSFALLLVSLFPVGAKADYLGNPRAIQNTPGYIDFDRSSPWYRGVLRENDRKKDGIERRTPAEILEQYFSGEQLNVSELESLIEQVKQKERVSFVAFCMEKLPPEANDSYYCLQDLSALNANLLKKWKSSKVAIAAAESVAQLQLAIKDGAELRKSEINSPAALAFLDHFFTGYELFETLIGEYENGIRARGVPR